MIIIRKYICFSFFLMMTILMTTQEIKAQSGKALFDKACMACHTIGGGRTVGPDLIGINQNRDRDWLISFIKSSQTMIKDGDALSIELFNEFMKIPMPDQNFSDSEINQILQYINEQGGSSNDVNTASSETTNETELVGDSNLGLDLFTGKMRFTNGGASCISCHTVNDEAVYFAGTFAKDLTESYTLMQKAGIESVLKYLSFPSMSDTYKDNPITSEEIANLTSYLQEVSEKQTKQQYAGFGNKLLVYGFIAFVGLLIIIEVFWRNKMPRSVNENAI